MTEIMVVGGRGATAPLKVSKKEKIKIWGIFMH